MAEDTLALVAAVNRPKLKLNLDLYHVQIGEGNLIEMCRKCLPYIGEIQVADDQVGRNLVQERSIIQKLPKRFIRWAIVGPSD